MPPNNRDDNKRPIGPVMDVQRPSSPPPQQPQTAPRVIQPNQPSSRPATMEYTRPRPAAEPAQTSSQFSPDPSRLPEDTLAPDNQKPPKQKKSIKKFVIITLVVVLIAALAGAGTYYYQQVMNKPEPAQPQPEPQPQPVEDGSVEATPEGVDQTVDAIDQQLNSLNDAEDFTPNDVSDQGLGI